MRPDIKYGNYRHFSSVKDIYKYIIFTLKSKVKYNDIISAN